jgi:hypothetical protein
MTMVTPTPQRLRRVIELACRAPSVHNTQPWLWRIVDANTVDLYADHSRQLSVADPDGRNLVLSCGAALHQAIEAAHALGLTPKPEPGSDSPEGHLLARVHFEAGARAPDATKRLLTLEQRCTDRRRFISWPVSETHLDDLSRAASTWGAQAIPITTETSRFRTELLMERARLIQASDTRYAEEQNAWIDHSPVDGLPSSSADPPSSARLVEHPSRFRAASGDFGGSRAVESTDGLAALCTVRDDPASWLMAGQALNALWLRATRVQLSIVPLSQVIEVHQTRAALREEIVGHTWPQLLLRVGWQEISRSTLPRTPRRPVDDVLLP